MAKTPRNARRTVTNNGRERTKKKHEYVDQSLFFRILLVFGPELWQKNVPVL